MGNRHVAIAIVGFRNPQDVRTCLEALSQSTYGDFAVYVCENGGPEAWRTLVETIPARLPGGQAVTAFDAGANLGYAGGVNRCIEAAGDSFQALWVLNPDTAPFPGALAALLERLDGGDVEAVGGVTIWADDRVQAYGGVWRSWLGTSTSIGMYAPMDAPVDAATIEARLDYISGASMLVSRRFVEVVGPMRADYFLYVEEIEWCLRARLKGVKLGFAPDARVRHYHATTMGLSGRHRLWPRMSIYLDARNRVRVTAQLLPTRLPTVIVGIMLHALWRYMRIGAWRQIYYTWEGVAAGLRGESGKPAWVA